MKYSHPKFFINEVKNTNSNRNKDSHKFNAKPHPNPLTYKENTKQNIQLDDVFHYYKCKNKNKNKKNETLHIEPIKSATIPTIKKIKTKNILSEENLINLMNKYIDYTMKKNQNKKKLKNNLTTLNEENKPNNKIVNKKQIYMESLIKKGILTEIRDLQKPKKETLKEKLTQKKKSFLEDIGIEPNNITSFQESNNSSNDNNKSNNNQNININTNSNTNNNYNIKINYDINNNININNNYYKTFTGICSTNKRLKYFSPKNNFDLYLYDDESFSDRECKKTPLKPKINQFEYIHKIKKERSKIQTNPNYLSVEPEHSKKKFLKILTPKIEITLNDSFRHKNKTLNKKINYSNYNSNRIKKNNNKINLKIKKNSNINSENEYTHKKSCRSPEELNKYIKNKKIKEKDNEEKKNNKKNKELFLKYKNLCTLNNNYIHNNCYRKFSPSYYNTISMRCKTHTSGFGLKDKRKENDKIISNNEPIKDNNSTLIDANEYYLNILESKKLIIKNLYSKTETQFYNKNQNNSNIELKNIDEYFNKINNKNDIIINNNTNPNINNNINCIKKKNDDKKEMIRKISKKINDALIKAKQIFSDEESDSVRNNEDINKDPNINNADNKDNNNINSKISEIKQNTISKKTDDILKDNRKELIEKENIINENKKGKVNIIIDEKGKEKEEDNKDIINQKNKEIFNKNINKENEPNNDNDMKINDKIRDKEIKDEETKKNENEKNKIKEEQKIINNDDNNLKNNEEIKDNKKIDEGIKNENKIDNNIKGKENIKDIKKDIKQDEEKIIDAQQTDNSNQNNNENKEIIIKEPKNISCDNFIEKKEDLKEKVIDSNKLNKFIDLLSKLIRKNIFINIYKYYIKIAIFEHYFTSISYFVAFCKKYPFIKLREHFYKSKVFTSLKELINPFIKRHLKFLLEKMKEKPKKLLNNFFEYNSDNINNNINNNSNKKENDINKIKKKIIENDFLLENLIDESAEEKVNSNTSDFCSNNMNTINSYKDIKINNEKEIKDKNIDSNEINDNINNEEIIINDEQKEKDISAERDKDNQNIIEWIEIETNQKKDVNEESINDKNNNKEIDNNKSNKKNNDISHNIYENIIISDENLLKDKNGLLLIQNNNNNEKSRNDTILNSDKNNNNINIENNKSEDKKAKINLDIIDKDKLTEEILDKILSSEISSKEALLIPKKKFKFEIKIKKSRSNLSSDGLNNSAENILKDFDISGLSQLSLSDENLSSLNDSIMSAYTEKSFFNKTIIDKKKHSLIYFYQKYIAPKLIKLIQKEIIKKYDRIFDNINQQYINNSDRIMMSLILQDADMLRNNFKCQNNEETISDIINKENLLKKFEPINKKIRNFWKIRENKDNKSKKSEMPSYDEYIAFDENMNKCLIECCIELINCERKYGENGNPLIWSSRMREIQFKYKKNDPNKLANFVCKNLFKFLKEKVGIITDNYENATAEQINSEREKRLVNIIRNELDEGDYLWKNLEMEETQLKVEVSDTIMDQLYNEIIEILEHIQLNRNKSELYHNKSIYACEEMPKLSFQQTTTENVELDNSDEDM